MRFGARRRAVGKHAGERAGRRSRQPEITPQGISAPPTDSNGVTSAAPPAAPVVERLSRRQRRREAKRAKQQAKQQAKQPEQAGQFPTPAPTPEPEPYVPPVAPVREPELVPATVGAPVEAGSADDTAERPAVREERQEERRERRRQRREAGAQAAPEARERVVRDVSAFTLTPPTANNGLFAVFQKRYLLKLLVRREISARYQGSFLGLLWSYIGPLCQFFIYWFVLGTIIGLHKEVENFGIHVFAGLVVVHFFTETFGAGTRSIVRNKAIVVKLALPREMFPVASMLVSLFHVFPQMVILTIACLAYGWTPDPVGVAALLLGLFIAMMLGTGCALMFSAANVFFRDFSNIVSVLQLFVRFSVPMIYPYSLVDDRFGAAAQYYLLNPLADCVLLVQRALWVGTTSDPAETARTDLPPDLLVWGLIMAGVSLVVLVIGQLVFSRLESRIPERL